MSSIGEIAKFRTSIQTDTINEFTSASGVTVDGVLLKDASITASGTGANTLVGLLTFGATARSDVALSTTVAAKLRSGSATYTDTTTAATGTVAHGTINSFDNPAIAATNASVTYTSATTLYIDGAPTAGSNVTIGTAYSLYVAGGDILFQNTKSGIVGYEAMSNQGTWILTDNVPAGSVSGNRISLSLNQASYNASRSFATAGGAVRGSYSTMQISGSSGTVAGATCYVGTLTNSGAGVLTDGSCYFAEAAVNSGGGTFTRYYSYYAEASTAAGTNYAFYANNAASGTERYNFYAAGTAPNVFTGAITTPRTTLTASATGSGAITVINNYHAVSGAGGAASTITTINGGIDGMMVVLKAVSDTVDITFATGGNILLDGGASFTCDTLNDTITLIYDGSLTKWLEIGRCNNA